MVKGDGMCDLLYKRVRLSSISLAFLVELSMAAIRLACSLQLFSQTALYNSVAKLNSHKSKEMSLEH